MNENKKEKDWLAWMKIPKSEGMWIHMFHAEKEQIRLEITPNCRFIYVRDERVGAVDFQTEVKLRLSPSTSPALIFRRSSRKSDIPNFWVYVYLKQWKN